MEVPQPGSRDALCRPIASTVESVTVDHAHAIELTLSDGARIVVPLTQPDGREAATFHPTPHRIEVW